MLSGKASKRKAIKMQGPPARPDVEFGSCKHHSLTSHPGSFYSTSGSIIFHDRSPSSFFLVLWRFLFWCDRQSKFRGT